jgi:hypothetical protein
VERAPLASPLVVGRYALYGEIASGGMATVRYGRLRGSAGFARTVAVKRLLEPFANSPEFVSMFKDEARLAARVRHPNVVSILDVVSSERELFLVMEYVHGQSLSRLMRAAKAQGEPVPLKMIAAILCGVLHGLHAAHEATSEQGEPLEIVHRDVSPQNILVGADGIARVLDFGVAKAEGQIHVTREGHVKGKLGYMAPEQFEQRIVDRRADIYSIGVVLWELLTGERLLAADTVALMVKSVLEHRIERPSARAPGRVSPAVDEVAMRALSRNPSDRFATARQMALALEESIGLASPAQLGDWVEGLAGDVLAERARVVAAIEKAPAHTMDVAPAPAAELAPTRDFALTVRKRSDRAEMGKGRRGVVVALIAGTVVAASMLLVAAFSSRGGQRGVGSTASSVSTASTLSTVPSAPSAPSTAVAVSVDSAPSAVPLAAVSVVPSASTSAPPSPRQPLRAPPRAASTSTQRCVVKTYVEPDGVKHFFNDCSPGQ